jgi:hypothetical protein
MENISEKIPLSLHENLSQQMIDIIIGAEKKSAVPTDLAKKIIYLWRQDQLATPTGISTLLEASMIVSTTKTFKVIDELGLNEITVALRNLK